MTTIHPSILIAARDKMIQQKVFENLLQLKYQLTKTSNPVGILNNKIGSNYHLLITTIDNIQQVQMLNRLDRANRDIKILTISNLPNDHLTKQITDCCLDKNFQETDLILSVNDLMANFNKYAKLQEIKEKIYSKRQAKQDFRPLTRSKHITQQIQKAETCAQQKKHTYISGPAGSGKSRFADFIYNSSPIEDKHYLYIDCKNFTEKHIRELLFENESGGKYYSDYLNEKFRGIIFIDNITDLKLEIQSQLVGRLSKIFSKDFENRNIQIISTSIYGKDEALDEFLLLPSLVKFLSEEKVFLTPLSKRKEDIILLFKHFQEFFINEYNLSSSEITQNFEYILKSYHWPKNIEQLKKVAQKFCFFGNHISEKQFAKLLRNTESEKPDIASIIAKNEQKPFHRSSAMEKH